MPELCEICGDEKVFIKNYDDGKWYGIACAAKAGNPDAARIMMMSGASDMIDRMMIPVQEVESVS